MTVEVFVADEQDTNEVDTIRWMRLAENVLAEEGVKGNAELSLLFVDATTISDLNKRFMDKEGPTDVLSFPIDGDMADSGRSPDSGGTGPNSLPVEVGGMPQLLGDLVLCPAVAERNASNHAGNYDDELALLIVHGILHLMGMDHEIDDEAEVMEARERELLAKFHVTVSVGNDERS